MDRSETLPSVLGLYPIDWVEADVFPTLHPGEIHVWWIDLANPIISADNLAANFSQLEASKAARFKFEIHRRRYKISRGSYRWLISRYLDIPAPEITFRLGEFGKPELTPDSAGRQLCLNSTDSQDNALCAFSWNSELGIDVECLPRKVNYFERIIQHHFTASERKTLLEFPDESREEAFLAAWTRKESFGKAEGVGIRYDMGQHALCDNLSQSCTEVQGLNLDQGKRWQQTQFRPPFKGIATLTGPLNLNSIKGFVLSRKI